MPAAAPPVRYTHSRTSIRLRASQIEFLECFCARVRRDSGRFLGTAAVVDTLVTVLPAARTLPASTRSQKRIAEGLSHDDPLRTFPIQLHNESLATLKMLSAAIRRETGAVVNMSAIVRPLVDWFAGMDIDTSAIGSLKDLEVLLRRRSCDK
jgi:hypothetical protein